MGERVWCAALHKASEREKRAQHARANNAVREALAAVSVVLSAGDRNNARDLLLQLHDFLDLRGTRAPQLTSTLFGRCLTHTHLARRESALQPQQDQVLNKLGHARVSLAPDQQPRSFRFRL